MERLTLRDDDGRALLTPYGLRIYCSTQATADCICKLEEALQAQEPLPVKYTTSTIRCPKCNKQITSRGAIHNEIKFCWKCGQAVKWK